MDYKTAQGIIEADRKDRKAQREAERELTSRYRVYWVNPITSLLHRLPFVDIYDENEGADVRFYLFFDRDCPLEEAREAVKQANADKMGVCIKSRWTTYLVERLS